MRPGFSKRLYVHLKTSKAAKAPPANWVDRQIPVKGYIIIHKVRTHTALKERDPKMPVRTVRETLVFAAQNMPGAQNAPDQDATTSSDPKMPDRRMSETRRFQAPNWSDPKIGSHYGSPKIGSAKYHEPACRHGPRNACISISKHGEAVKAPPPNWVDPKMPVRSI